MDVEAGIQFMQKNYGDIDKRIFAHPSKAEAGELSGVVFEIDDSTGKTINIEQILPKSFK
jgi:calcineurin-like phosphoesterase